MNEFDQTLAQYGILAKNAQKLIEKDRISIFGDTIIETIDFKILQEKGIKELDISDSKFINILYIENVYLNFNFFNVHFTDVVQIKEASFDYFILMQCVFEDNFFLDQISSKGQVNFYRTKFNKIVHFVNSEFIGQVDFAETEFFDKVDFNNIKVKDYINLVNLVFWKVFEINKAHLNSFTIAKKIIFHEEVAFLEIEVEKNIHIFDAKFENKITLGVKDFDKMEFIDSKALGEVDFGQSKGKEVIIKNSNFDNNMMLSYAHFENLLIKRSTLKEISLSINNFTLTQNINFKDIAFGKLYIPKELFVKSVDFERCIFLQDINLKDYTFNEVAFNTCTFKESVYFNNSWFKKEVDFHECEFEKTACFYGVTFDKAPNFSQALFKSNINVINSNLNFDYARVDEKIKLLSSQGKGKYNYEIANDFRDSFRNFKSALIKDNNFLDASNFHKYELYCKEIELKNKKGKTLKDIVDKWQLFFYRKLCDHHTDLLKVFHNLLIIIMLFSVFSFVLDKFKQPSIENHAKYHIVQVDTNESYIFKEHNKTTYNFLSLNIEQEFKNLDNLLSKTEIYFSLGFVLLVTFVALLNKQYLWFLLLPLFVGVVYCVEFPMSIIAHFMIIMLFVCTFVFIMVFDSKPERFLFVSVSYIVCIFTLLAKPSLMLPVLGSFLEKDSNATYPLLLSLSVVYFILVALVIFSLQKTARKNSIVPS
ncbi:pentapeptide repeat-containing protein [Campylobacter sp. IFREMER_LSEM_CL1085]|nr:pentapeptide repeat-containing protein [Campylobacter sp. IFREMER_LSEM_CL1085]MCV3424796.1 pentapeptide repeat-containing protein [Campylobacter sp. IFREMER_LSEM_CL1085]